MITIGQYSNKPEQIAYYPQRDGTAEVYLRKNIRREPDGEGGQIWTAEEVFLHTRLTKKEVDAGFDSYFEEVIPMTIEDLAEAVDILAGIILEG